MAPLVTQIIVAAPRDGIEKISKARLRQEKKKKPKKKKKKKIQATGAT